MPMYLPVIHTLTSLSCVIAFMSNPCCLSCCSGQTEVIPEHLRTYLLTIIQRAPEYTDVFVTEDLVLLKVKKQ